jgi:hypothetical protein
MTYKRYDVVVLQKYGLMLVYYKCFSTVVVLM